MTKKIKIKIQLHLLKRTTYKEHNMMEEIAHGLCDNYVKPSKPGVHWTLTLVRHLPWTVISAKAGEITIKFASTYHYYFPDFCLQLHCYYFLQ